MERLNFMRLLREYDLHVRPARGGDHRIETSDGKLVCGRFNPSRKRIGPKIIQNISRGARQLGIVDFPTSTQCYNGEWHDVVAARRAERRACLAVSDENDAGAVPTYRAVAELAEEVQIEEAWLLAELRATLPETAFWRRDKKAVDDGLFAEWYVLQDFAPVTEAVVSVLGCDIEEAKAQASKLQRGGHLPLVPGCRGKARRWLVRRGDVRIALEAQAQFYREPETLPESLPPTSMPEGLGDVSVSEKSYQLMRVTPEKAEEFLGLNDSIVQRYRKKRILHSLVRKARAGRLFGGRVAIGELPDGSRHLVDGQHYLTTLASEGLTRTTAVQIFSCRNVKDLWYLATCFNMAPSVKTTKEKIDSGGVLAGLTDEYIKKGHVTQHVKSLRNYLDVVNKETGAYHTQRRALDDERLQGLVWREEFAPVLGWVDTLYTACREREIKRKQPAAVAMIWHWYIDPLAADKFWRPIFTGVPGFDNYAPPKRDPRHLARELLTEFTATEGASNRRRASREEFFYTLNKYWNLFRAGQPGPARVRLSQNPVKPR